MVSPALPCHWLYPFVMFVVSISLGMPVAITLAMSLFMPSAVLLAIPLANPFALPEIGYIIDSSIDYIIVYSVIFEKSSS